MPHEPQHLVGIGSEHDHPGEDISALDAIENLPGIADAAAFAIGDTRQSCAMAGGLERAAGSTPRIGKRHVGSKSTLRNLPLSPSPFQPSRMLTKVVDSLETREIIAHLDDRLVLVIPVAAPDEDSEGDKVPSSSSTSGQGVKNLTSNSTITQNVSSMGFLIAPATSAAATITSFSPPLLALVQVRLQLRLLRQLQHGAFSLHQLTDAMAQDQSGLSSSLPLPLTCTNLPNVVHNSISQGLLHSKWTFCKPYSQISSKDFYSSGLCNGPKSFALSQAIVSTFPLMGLISAHLWT
ncbi:hypothetical protein SELMODRAFT_403378 [Selaginella moellendorffii]|uniref:Uncharacterized protein n=1 Tax=Selaginella moellendorffii TaxID=88036 RepID=D8QTZ6_SELML|nr:hypothetical protein SELMODRAFT_403378 [Selaginella moellendorffii]